MRLFTKAERSSFPYWFAHWCSFNMTAIMCEHWKVGYLFHDWYKPWLRIFLPYAKVQKFHRLHSKHHLEWVEKKLEKLTKNGTIQPTAYKLYRCLQKVDWYGMMIDWECSRHTKLASPLTAQQEMYAIFNDKEKMEKKFPLIQKYINVIKLAHMIPALEKLGIWTEEQK